jgi:hypothetical protein
VLLGHFEVAGDGFPAANTSFQVEFGRCNDQPSTGVAFPMGLATCGSTYLQPCIFQFTVDSRDKLVTIHFVHGSSTGRTDCPSPPSYGDACWKDQGHHPQVRFVLVKKDDGGGVPSSLSPDVVNAYAPPKQATCDSTLRGAYPNYEWLGGPLAGYVSATPYFPEDGGSGGLSGGAIAALVIFLGVVPLAIAGIAVVWVLVRKKAGQPIIPEKLTSMLHRNASSSKPRAPPQPPPRPPKT